MRGVSMPLVHLLPNVPATFLDSEHVAVNGSFKLKHLSKKKRKQLQVLQPQLV